MNSSGGSAVCAVEFALHADGHQRFLLDYIAAKDYLLALSYVASLKNFNITTCHSGYGIYRRSGRSVHASLPQDSW